MHSSSSPRHRPARPTTPAEFALAFTSTPRGARLARLFVAQCLDSWGHPYDGHVNETLTLITAELCANAVRHGRVPGRDFHVRLVAEADGARLRLEVSDTRAERRPATTALTDADPDAESGRGLLLVAALADDWGVIPRPAAPGKTVWAEVLQTSRTQDDLSLHRVTAVSEIRRCGGSSADIIATTSVPCHRLWPMAPSRIGAPLEQPIPPT